MNGPLALDRRSAHSSTDLKLAPAGSRGSSTGLALGARPRSAPGTRLHAALSMRLYAALGMRPRSASGTRLHAALGMRLRSALGVVRWALPAALTVLVCVAAGAQGMGLPEPEGMTGDPAASVVLDGNAAFLRGDLTAAARDYHAALKRKPDFAIAYFNLGLVEAHQGRRTRGLADMDRGIALAGAHHMSTAGVGRLRTLRAAFASQPVST